MREQVRGGGRREAAHGEDGHVVHEPGRDRARAAGQQEGDGVGAQPAGGEEDGHRRLLVQPLQVVDDHQDGAPLRGRGEQGEGRRPDQEAVRRTGPG